MNWSDFDDMLAQIPEGHRKSAITAINAVSTKAYQAIERKETAADRGDTPYDEGASFAYMKANGLLWEAAAHAVRRLGGKVAA